MRKTLLFILIFAVSLAAQNGNRAITIEDLWKMGRISQLKLSPDSRRAAFTLTYFDMEENKSNSDVWIVDTETKELKQITNSPKGDNSPEWFPDSKTLVFVSSREGTPQIYSVNTDKPEEIKKLTNIHFGASGPVISPDGKKMLFISEVYPDCADDNCNKMKDEEKEKSKVKAKIFTELLYRHWDSWREDRVSHLFLMDLNDGKTTDVMQGKKNDIPPIALGGKLDYCFSPDGKEISFVYNPDKMVAISTNNEVFTIESDLKNIKLISTSEGNDNQPVYSKDGKYIFYRQMKRAGFEADKYDLIKYERATGKRENLTEKLDRSVDEVVVSSNEDILYFSADNEGRKAIYKLNINAKTITKLYDKHWNTDINISDNGSFLIFSQSSVNGPAEIFKFEIDTKNILKLTEINEKLITELKFSPLEEFWSEGADGKKVHSYLIKPPFFDPEKKYPMIFLVHGGPQGAWEDLWHYRWNPQLYASPGYVVIMTNPRGSTGYGQQFTDEISGDWGGKAYIDLMNAYDFAVKKYKFIDKNKTGASGASYGGYMMNWIATKTDRFKAIVTHAGVYNLESMYGTTEELWFPEWENKGTPWQNRELYRKFSPHQFIQNAKTPMLITHGSNDFRVPESQAMELFTSLQRLGVPSKFILFPDETHFVAKPQNFRLWMTEIFKWFDYWFNK